MCAEQTWYERIPKAELHLHLEGAIPHTALWELVKKYGGDPTAPTLQALGKRFEYRDFTHFIETWRWMVGFLREYEDYTLIAEAVARDLVRQNIRYVEAFYSPGGAAEDGLEIQRITEAIRSGLQRVPAVKVNLVADLIRDLGPEFGAISLAAVNEVKTYGVIGVGIGGSEQRFPPEPYAGVYERARALGFRTSAHAGEAAGAQSIWGAIRSLNVDRIGHGTRAMEDPALVEYLAKTGIPLEVCPLSNVRTAVVSSIESHPVRKYFNAGIKVTVSTDDPSMFNNSLAQEYKLLEGKLGFSKDEIRALILQSLKSSWLSETEKQKLMNEFSSDPVWTE